MAATNLRIYLTHNQLILINDQGFRFEFPVPTPGNVLTVHVGQEAFLIGLHPPETPRSPSPNISEWESDDSSSLVTPPNEGEGEDEGQAANPN